MKLLSRNFVRGGPGLIKVVPEEGEDLWHAYNLIREGDLITATTFRKVARESGTGADSERVKLKLTVAVEGVEYDAEGQQIRLKGKNLTENEHVKLGAYHTLELDLQRAFTLQARRFLPFATQPLLPSKQPSPPGGGLAVLRHVDWEVVKCLVVAGPGFAKDAFLAYLDTEAQRREAKVLLQNRSKILTAPASSAYKHSLKEVIAAAAVAAQIKDTKAAREVKALQDFMAMLAHDPARAFYGPGHVFAAHELGAIQTLLITDSLFRTTDTRKRKKWVAAGGGEVLVFSGMHASGEQLNQLTGVAALLRFPLPDLEDQELEGEI
eukprot:scaffold11.g3861.t1